MEKEFRPRFEVLVRIGWAFNNEPRMKKTHLHLATRIRWNSFVKYLDWLLINNRAQCTVEDATEIYSLTDSGREMFEKLLKLAEETGTTRLVAVL